MIRVACSLIMVVAVASGCGGRSTAEAKPKADISEKVRVDNLPIRVEREQRLSDTEAVKVIIVPRYPYGQRCIVYVNGPARSMQCDEIFATEQ